MPIELGAMRSRQAVIEVEEQLYRGHVPMSWTPTSPTTSAASPTLELMKSVARRMVDPARAAPDQDVVGLCLSRKPVQEA